MKTKNNELLLLVDTIKDPRDMAELVHLALATNRCVEITGNSLTHTHPKVSRIISSWKPDYLQNQGASKINYSNDYFQKINHLKKEGYTIIGTSPNKGESLFETNFSKGKHVAVFGTEVGGLSREKIKAVDKMVRVPMLNETRFYTLRTIIPIVVHEILRQKGLFGKPTNE
jgi:tRNA(Leu) C34 or U34 (ribose-2'-O)-methylase TrmL